jgi:HPt (histidine-containing phosphotransfer) domain-containing protein
LTPEQQIHAQLLNRGEEDKDFLRVYIDAFLDDTSSRLKLIDAAAEREDWHAARRECHALRGACLEMGAAAMEKHCVSVGNAAENGNASQARDAVRDLEKEFDHIRPVFTAAKKHFSA